MRGYEVLVASSGQQALRIAEERGSAIDLLLTDVIMPKMSGPQLAKRLAKIVPRTKVLFMSAHTATYKGIASDYRAFLQKPFTPSTLAQKVREVLQGKPRPSEAVRPQSGLTRARQSKKGASSQRRSQRARRS